MRVKTLISESMRTLYGALCPLQHEGEPGLRKQAAAVVAGGPVHANTHVHASIQQLPNLHRRV